MKYLRMIEILAEGRRSIALLWEQLKFSGQQHHAFEPYWSSPNSVNFIAMPATLSEHLISGEVNDEIVDAVSNEIDKLRARLSASEPIIDLIVQREKVHLLPTVIEARL